MKIKINRTVMVTAALWAAGIVGAIVALYGWGGPTTEQVKAIYDLGRLQRCWECYQALDKDAPVGVVRFHADKLCVKEGKPW